MKIWKIPVTWEVCSTIDVEAESLDEAIRIFDINENSDNDYTLPTDAEYVGGSFGRENIETCQLNNE